MQRKVLYCLLLSVVSLSKTSATEDLADGEDQTIFSCAIESCGGWRLNKLPEVKQFIREDFEKKYVNTKFNKIPGKSPELIFYNQGGEVLERLDITKLSRLELNELMEKKGISKKQEEEEVELDKNTELW